MRRRPAEPSPNRYLRRAISPGKLVRREVTAEDVAQAFPHHAVALKTTGAGTTVDGGNINAMLR